AEIDGRLNVGVSLALDALELGLSARDGTTSVRRQDRTRLLRLVLERARVLGEILEVAVERLPRRVEKVDRVVAGVRRRAAVLRFISERRGVRAPAECGHAKRKDECAHCHPTGSA